MTQLTPLYSLYISNTVSPLCVGLVMEVQSKKGRQGSDPRGQKQLLARKAGRLNRQQIYMLNPHATKESMASKRDGPGVIPLGPLPNLFPFGLVTP